MDPKEKRALVIVEFDKETEMLRALGVEKDNYDSTLKYLTMALL